MLRRIDTTVLLSSVFVVNFLSLVYQVIWVRKLMVVFGSTALSVSTVLTVFLAGIALGSYFGSVWIRRTRRKYRFLGLSLVFLGLYCLASDYLLGSIYYPFQYITGAVESPMGINILKLFFSFMILIFPTMVIGSVFPVVTYLYSEEFRRFGRDVASIYSLDTLGAGGGVLLAGFVLVPVVGLWAASFFSALVYIVNGLVVLWVARERDAVFSGTDNPASPGARGRGLELDTVRVVVLAALFLGGFAALVLEVTWSRYFHLIFGTSIYAFSLVVAAFLLGLSAGSFIAKRTIDRVRNPLLLFAYVEVLIAGFSLFVLLATERLEILYMKLFNAAGNFYLFQGTLFFVAFLLMLIPTVLMGFNFPLAVKIFGRNRETRERDAGVTFSVNTAGGILGAFAAGFVVIPVLGLAKTTLLASIVYFAVGFVLLYFSAGRRLIHLSAAVALTVVFLGTGVLRGGEPALGLAVYYHGVMRKTTEDFLDLKRRSEILYSRHGYYGLVTVLSDIRTRNVALYNNGKADASTGILDMQTQLLLGHLPLFLHEAPEKVLNIGLGGGFSLGAIKSHPNVREIDVVEIDPLVVEATGKHFGAYNNDALVDPRIRVHVQDGRHFLETTREKYDVIISEPPNIWVSGVSQLFTEEFYRIVDRRLEGDGMLVQWVPTYEMYPEDLKLILKTIRGTFEYVAYWTNGGDTIILASHRMHEPEPSYVGWLMQVPRIAEDVQFLMPGADPGQMTKFLLFPNVGFDSMDEFIGGIDLVNTDNLPYLEFKTARNMFNKLRQKD